MKMGAKFAAGSFLLKLIAFQMIQSVSSFKCYVCQDMGKPEDIYNLKKDFPDHSVQSCSTYTADASNKFLLECPTSGDSGCLTKIEANGAVVRKCAPIAFEECKEANGVNYCYCKSEGCNSPDRKLSNPSLHPHNLTSFNLGEAKAAARVSSSDKSFTRFFDDEDFDEGSGDWGDFYYDDNYYFDRNYDYPDTYGDDEDDVDGAFDGSDVTDPPPYLNLENPVGHKVHADAKHKYDRDRFRNTHNNIRRPDSFSDSDFSIDDGTESIHSATTKPKHSNSHSVTYFFCHHLLAGFLLILIKSEVLVGI